MTFPTIDEYRCATPAPHRLEGGLRCTGQFNRRSEPGRPLISIVTVTRNAEKTLERTILSVLQQTYDNLEYIVIDGNSTDGTLEVIRKFDKKIAYWLSEPDGGIFDAMNKGISLASGSYIGILNADDYYLPEALQRAVAAIQTAPAEVIYGDYIFTARDVGMEYLVTVSLRLATGMTLGHQSMFVSTEAYSNVGLYDTSFAYAGDFDFALRALKKGLRFTKAAAPLACFSSGGAAEQHLVSTNIEAARVIRRHEGTIRVIPFALRFARRMIARCMLSAFGALFGQAVCLSLKKRYYRRTISAKTISR